MMLPRPALALWSHSCCRCRASPLMSACVCSSDVLANKSAVVLQCLRSGITEQLHQVSTLVLGFVIWFCMALPGVAAWWSLLFPGSTCARCLMHDPGSTAGLAGYIDGLEHTSVASVSCMII